MKLQPASKQAVKQVALGTGLCSALMTAGLAATGAFDHRILLGAVGGSLVAIANFTILCLTIQNAVIVTEQKHRKAILQGSYSGRLLLQAAWITAAFLSRHIHVLTAAIPLLFPNLTIFFLQARGTLVSRSQRRSPPAREEPAPKDLPGPFEV